MDAPDIPIYISKAHATAPMDYKENNSHNTERVLGGEIVTNRKKTGRQKAGVMVIMKTWRKRGDVVRDTIV